jgi:hypothetical protein
MILVLVSTGTLLTIEVCQSTCEFLDYKTTSESQRKWKDGCALSIVYVTYDLTPSTVYKCRDECLGIHIADSTGNEY